MGEYFAVTSASSGSLLVRRCRRAATFLERFRGLLGRSSMADDEGLLIENCRMVHMLGMRFPIDAVFCSSQNVVVHISNNLRPWQISRHVFGSSYVIEIAAGRAQEAGFQLGDKLEFGREHSSLSSDLGGHQIESE
ncbi:MAG: DUF192 domain-containing protein [Bdellovibrionales bacterium]|nr:DUF192 domain-containing protein [Bdellovibrionales bacterium]